LWETITTVAGSHAGRYFSQLKKKTVILHGAMEQSIVTRKIFLSGDIR
jgi:hypothetical protein